MFYHNLSSYRDMIVVLAELLGAGDQFPLCDPLLQVVNLPRQLEETQSFVQLSASLAGQIL